MIIRIIICLLVLFCFSDAFAENFKLAVYPSNDPKKLIVPMRIMADYLTEKTGDSFTAIVTRDYDELSERLKNKSVHVAWINPINYIKIKTENPALKYIATYMEKNEETGEVIPYYQSFIVSLKNSGIHTLADAEGMRFAFTDPGSTSGYAFPNLMLRQKNIVPKHFFKKVFFLKKHDRVIEALVNQSIDLGGVSDGTYYTAVRRHGDIFTIIEKSDSIPLDAIVAPENFPDAKIKIYKKALTDMSENHPFNRSMRENLGWNAAGFAIKDDQFYNAMRKALK
jgi:phosphonate transport system substrate-binding protein